MENKIIKPKEVMEILNISSATLSRWEVKGIIKPIQITGKWGRKCYDLNEIKKLLPENHNK